MASTPSVMTLHEDAISWTPTDEGLIVVLDLRTSRYLNLNSAAATLWLLLAKGASEADLVNGLVQTYHLPREAAMADVAAFLTELRSRDLIREAG